MSTEDRAKLRAQLVRHEALKLKPYVDTVGRLTIGVGRNLDDQGINEDEAFYLLSGDIDRVIRGLLARYPGWFPTLDPVRQATLVNMGVNLGLGGLAGFTRMLDAIARGDYARAADEMTASKWATQVGMRAGELAVQMRTGAWVQK
jgi:lysozyme